MRKSFVRLTMFLAIAAGLAGQQPRYVGAGGCASSNCHGGTSAAKESESRIWGNEYAIWSLNDKHSKAWQVLADPRSKRMAQILGIADAQKDAKCTGCHAAGSPEKSVSDGVSCEACHGPSEKWLGLHVQPNSHAQSVAAGMIDTKDLVLRANNCLECHLGTKDRVVNHEVIAAGHPDLNFELDTFAWAQPTHHRDPKPAAGNSLPRMRAWAVGQAAGFTQGMKLLGTRASSSWPEFSELECYQCHHDLRLDSWRIQRGYPGRKPGSLVPNTARTEVLRILVAQAAAGRMGATDAAINSVMGAISNRLHDGPGVARAAGEAAGLGDALAAQFAKQDFTQDQARSMVKALVAAIPRIANAGVHAAEVATMSLDSLTATYAPGAQQAMAPLYDYLEHPSVYQPAEFVALFRRAADAAN